MQSVLIVIHLIVVLALVGVVLLQRSEGGGLGLGGGGVSGFMTGRGQTNVLTRTTAILATAFFATSLILTILAGHQRGPRSILDTGAPATVPAAPGAPSAPTGGSVLDQLKRMQGETSGQSAPAAPAAPQAPTAQ